MSMYTGQPPQGMEQLWNEIQAFRASLKKSTGDTYSKELELFYRWGWAKGWTSPGAFPQDAIVQYVQDPTAHMPGMLVSAARSFEASGCSSRMGIVPFQYPRMPAKPKKPKPQRPENTLQSWANVIQQPEGLGGMPPVGNVPEPALEYFQDPPEMLDVEQAMNEVPMNGSTPTGQPPTGADATSMPLPPNPVVDFPPAGRRMAGRPLEPAVTTPQGVRLMAPPTQVSAVGPAPMSMSRPAQRANSQGNDIAKMFTQNSRIQFWKRGPDGAIEAVGRPLVAADLQGFGNLTDFVTKQLVPNYGPFPGEPGAIYVAERLDAFGRTIEPKEEIRIAAQRGGFGGIPGLPGLGGLPPVHGPSAAELELARQARVASEKREARMDELERRTMNGQGNSAETFMLLQELRREREAGQRTAVAPTPSVFGGLPPLPPGVDGSDAVRSIAESALSQVTKMAESARAIPVADPLAAVKLGLDMAMQAGGPGRSDAASMEMKLLQQQMEFDRKLAERDRADAERRAQESERRAEEARRSTEALIMKMDEGNKAMMAQIIASQSKGGVAEKLGEIEAVLGAAQRLTGGGQSSLADAFGAIGNIFQSPLGEGIKEYMTAAGQAAAETAKRGGAPVPPARPPQQVRNVVRPTPLPAAALHALNGLREAPDSESVVKAVMALLRAAWLGGKFWQERAKAIGAGFARIRMDEEMPGFVLAVFDVMGRRDFIQQSPGLVTRISAALVERYSELHQALTGNPKGIIIAAKAAPAPKAPAAHAPVPNNVVPIRPDPVANAANGGRTANQHPETVVVPPLITDDEAYDPTGDENIPPEHRPPPDAPPEPPLIIEKNGQVEVKPPEAPVVEVQGGEVLELGPETEEAEGEAEELESNPDAQELDLHTNGSAPSEAPEVPPPAAS
jgi:hypothetical protein